MMSSPTASDPSLTQARTATIPGHVPASASTSSSRERSTCSSMPRTGSPDRLVPRTTPWCDRIMPIAPASGCALTARIHSLTSGVPISSSQSVILVAGLF